MIWQLAAMWLIVGTTIVWFVRDERRLRHATLSAQALHFSKVPHDRRPAADGALPPAARVSVMSGTDQAIRSEFLRKIGAL
ncbi:hypothetical protein [uncultured Devosia sp.]|uniref:hypothetical protein n=1 Tax=uncultured Devosia sp. TaxID=211434 RepID=UPI0035C94FA2